MSPAGRPWKIEQLPQPSDTNPRRRMLVPRSQKLVSDGGSPWLRAFTQTTGHGTIHAAAVWQGGFLGSPAIPSGDPSIKFRNETYFDFDPDEVSGFASDGLWVTGRMLSTQVWGIVRQVGEIGDVMNSFNVVGALLAGYEVWGADADWTTEIGVITTPFEAADVTWKNRPPVDEWVVLQSGRFSRDFHYEAIGWGVVGFPDVTSPTTGSFEELFAEPLARAMAVLAVPITPAAPLTGLVLRATFAPTGRQHAGAIVFVFTDFLHVRTTQPPGAALPEPE